mgnify:CR=1 FL=1
MKIEDKDKVLRQLADLRYKKGWSRQALVDMLKDKYKIGDTRAYELIKEMMVQCADSYNKLNQNALADSVSFMEEMRQKALSQDNEKLALEWSKELNKVNQLYVDRLKLEGEVKIQGIEITIKKNDEK